MGRGAGRYRPEIHTAGCAIHQNTSRVLTRICNSYSSGADNMRQLWQFNTLTKFQNSPKPLSNLPMGWTVPSQFYWNSYDEGYFHRFYNWLNLSLKLNQGKLNWLKFDRNKYFNLGPLLNFNISNCPILELHLSNCFLCLVFSQLDFYLEVHSWSDC